MEVGGKEEEMEGVGEKGDEVEEEGGKKRDGDHEALDEGVFDAEKEQNSEIGGKKEKERK